MERQGLQPFMGRGVICRLARFEAAAPRNGRYSWHWGNAINPSAES